MLALRDLDGSSLDRGANTKVRRTRRLVEVSPGMATRISGEGVRIMAQKENVRQEKIYLSVRTCG